MRSILWIVLALPAAVAAASQVVLFPQPPLFRSQINLTTVTATVLDRNGALVTGLPREVPHYALAVKSDAELESVYGPLGQPITVYAHIHRSYIRSVSSPQRGEACHQHRQRESFL